MTKLDELIKEYCPNGVEYKTIGDCTLKTTNIRWKQENRSFRYIDLTSVDRDTHRIVETTFVNKDTAPSRAQQIVQTDDVLFGGTRPMLKRYCLVPEEYNGQVCSTGFCVLRPNNNIILTNWLYHHISSSAFYSHVEMYQKGASYPAITDVEVKMFKIPVPPLAVQEEIVRILDNLSELMSELQRKLEEETAARKKQYEYYRDFLLTFDDNSSQFVNVERERRGRPVRWLTVESLCKISRGKVISKDDVRNNPGNYPVFSSQTENNGELGRISTYMFDGEYLTWTTDGANAGTVFYRNGQFNITNVCGLIEAVSDLVIPKYLFYILKTEAPKYVNSGMGNPKLMSNVMARIKVPVPSVDEQRRIVSILDRFDALCNDITAGLPAEIEARQKQYEYYRDKLLTFKEAM